MKNNNSVIAYISTFPPRECGIATFTADLTAAFDDLFAPGIDSVIVAMNQDEVSKYDYSEKVFFQISQNNENDYRECARKINEATKIKLVHIEHEFGIFGNNFGSKILCLLSEIKKPIVITLHTVLPNPVAEMKNLIQEINESVRLIFVMTKTSKQILMTDYNIAEEKIRIVPHGIHPSSYSPSRKNKKELQLKDKTVLSTFGLLGPGKGIEYALEALPNVVREHPEVVYAIIGATHPVILKNDGEVYRNMLEKKIKDLGLEQHVFFYNEYFTKEKLLNFLKETDIYLSLSLDPNQAVSGTLSYALGAGRPVISTAFAQAKEDVTSEVGYLVDFKQPKQIESAILDLLKDRPRLGQMSKNAYFRTRNMVWQNVALSYIKEIMKVIPEMDDREKNCPKIKLDHLVKMTDDFGLLQFAKLTEPDPKYGYTLDDNVRALTVVTEFYKKNKDPELLRLAKIYLDFIEFTYIQPGFNNYIDGNRSPDEKLNKSENLEDSHARSLYSLASVVLNKEIPDQLIEQAKNLFKIGQEKISNKITSPRALSFYIMGLCKWYENNYDKNTKDDICAGCEYLIKLYESTNSTNWQWFEDILTYSNSVMPQALLSAYKVMGDERYFNIAKTTLDFLISHSFKETICVPIGQEKWYKKGSVRTYFDQQPEEVASLVQALHMIYDITKDYYYKELMMYGFNWFLGNNLLGQVVYDQETGGCYDGVQESKVNLNQGAESTVSYLIARLTIQNESFK